ILYSLAHEVKANKDTTEKKSLFMLIYAPLLFFAYKGTIYNLVTKTFYQNLKLNRRLLPRR
ncbi:MAG: hypothetical protein J6A00_08430, partial [Bacteroides sp.]|nr:hypothetical protein [Bacteroides sp.]